MIKSSLPPESAPWGTDIEKRLRALETAASNLNTLTGSNNARLSSLSSARSQLSGQQIDLDSQQEQLQAQVDFLSTQTDYAVTDASAYAYFVTSPQTGYTVPYDVDRSATITFTTSGTGMIAVESQCSWVVSPAINTYFGIDWTAYVEVLEDSTVIKGRSTGAPQSSVTRYLGFPSTGTAFYSAESVSIMNVLALDPNTEYTARTRLFVNSLSTDNDLTVSPMSLKITKLGM